MSDDRLLRLRSATTATPSLVTKMARLALVFTAIFGVSQVQSAEFVFGGEARRVCKAYKRVCSDGKVCALQTIDWPHTMKFPVCVYRQHKQVKSTICRKAPLPGRCAAKFTRWYYNIHMQACSWFTYSGCGGNKNNFRTFEECTKTCTSVNDVTNRRRDGRNVRNRNTEDGNETGTAAIDDDANIVDDSNGGSRRVPIPARAPEVIDLTNDVTATFSLEKKATQVDNDGDNVDDDDYNISEEEDGGGEKNEDKEVDEEEEEEEDKIAARLARRLKEKQEKRRRRKLERENRRREKLLRRRERERRKALEKEKKRIINEERKRRKEEKKMNNRREDEGRDGLVIIKGDRSERRRENEIFGNGDNDNDAGNLAIPELGNRDRYGRNDENENDINHNVPVLNVYERDRIAREKLRKQRIYQRKQQEKERERLKWQRDRRRNEIRGNNRNNNDNNNNNIDRNDRRNQARQLTPLELGPYYDTGLLPVTLSSPEAVSSSLGTRHGSRKWLIDDMFGMGRNDEIEDGRLLDGMSRSRSGSGGRMGRRRGRGRRRRRRRRRRSRIVVENKAKDNNANVVLRKRGQPTMVLNDGNGGDASKNGRSRSGAVDSRRSAMTVHVKRFNRENDDDRVIARSRHRISAPSSRKSMTAATTTTRTTTRGGRRDFAAANTRAANEIGSRRRSRGKRKLTLFGLLDKE